MNGKTILLLIACALVTLYLIYTVPRPAQPDTGQPCSRKLEVGCKGTMSDLERWRKERGGE